jgi:hypothetical protein
MNFECDESFSTEGLSLKQLNSMPLPYLFIWNPSVDVKGTIGFKQKSKNANSGALKKEKNIPEK